MRERAAIIEGRSECGAPACTKCLVTNWRWIICVLALTVASVHVSFAARPDHGAIGGSYPGLAEQGREAGRLAARVLNGQKPDSIPIVQGPPALVHVDWRQLHRWRIPASALPADAVILYRPPTERAHYGRGVVIGLALIAALALLISAWLWQRAHRQKRNLLRLHESENRFRLMADTIPTLIWMSDKTGSVTYLNDKRQAFTVGDHAIGPGRTSGLRSFILTTCRKSSQLMQRRSNSRKAIQRNTGFAGMMACTDGCWTSRRRVSMERAHLPGLLARQSTLQTRNWRGKLWRISAAN